VKQNVSAFFKQVSRDSEKDAVWDQTSPGNVDPRQRLKITQRMKAVLAMCVVPPNASVRVF